MRGTDYDLIKSFKIFQLDSLTPPPFFEPADFVSSVCWFFFLYNARSSLYGRLLFLDEIKNKNILE